MVIRKLLEKFSGKFFDKVVECAEDSFGTKDLCMLRLRLMIELGDHEVLEGESRESCTWAIQTLNLTQHEIGVAGKKVRVVWPICDRLEAGRTRS